MNETHAFGDFDVTVIVTSPPWYENCYLVHHRPANALAIIDPGGDAGRILAAVKGISAASAEILLTHGHPDHLGAVAALQEALNLPCRAHAAEEGTIAKAGALSAALMGQHLSGPRTCDYFSGEPTLTVGGAPVKVVHTPGHTPGGVCYDFGGFVFTGDTLFNHGIGRTDLPGGNAAQLTSSIGRLLEVLPEDAVLFSGHGPEWIVGEARQWWRYVL